MKLRNKKTGEIITPNIYLNINEKIFVEDKISHKNCKAYKSLSELTDEWEDYEEPNGFIIDIEAEGYIEEAETYADEAIERAKEVGNYFETEEEAEKAVEKLKAIKKLKEEGGLVLKGCDAHNDGKIVINAEFFGVSPTDYLDLLFGGEDE